jgi:predicted permease
METLVQDFRHALRQLRKNPGFTAIAVLTLALGIAVNATMFSMVSAFLLRRPPGRDPEHVAVVTGVDPAQGFQADASALSAPNYLAWREANHVFAEMAAADEYRTVSISSRQHSPESIRSAAVSANFFSVLGVTPQLGRTFTTGEDQAGRDHVVVLSHELWERQFGSDPAVVGSTVRLDRETYSVIGVMPASFRLMGFTPQLWTPLVLSPTDQTAAAHRDRSLFLFARMKPGTDLEQARAEFSTLAHQAEASFPETEKGWGATVRTLPDFLIYSFGIRSALAVLMTTVGFVLMIACANVAGLMLARATGRRKEMAIRVSLGASRLRVIRQLLTEGLAIAFLGGATGLLFAFWGINLIRANMNFNDAISAVSVSLDRNVLLFAGALSVVCAVLCGLAPALNASRTDVASNLKEESRAASPGRSRSRLRTVMVAGEIALALFLLVGTGLLIRALSEIAHQNLGFQPDHLLTAGLSLDKARYEDASRQSLFVRDLLSRLRSLPGAEVVAAASDLPATGPGSVTLHIKGQEEAQGSQGLTTLDFVVTPDYLRTSGIALVHGRTFTEADDAAAPRVVLVNQKFIERYLAGQEAVGQQVRLEVNGAASGWGQIVGVVGNVKTYSEATRDEPEVYEAFLQRPVSSFSIMVRTASDPNVLVSGVRNAVAQLDAELPLARVMSMPAVIQTQRAGNPFFANVLTTFAILALLLAAIGVYGLIAYSVGQRAHEIGIRMALGARRQDVLRMVLGESMKMAAVGAAVGLVMALPLPKLFDAIFFDLHVNELWVYFVVPVAILTVAMMASYVPARRAARVEPMIALRQE